MIDLPSNDLLFLPIAIFAAITIGLAKGGLPAMSLLSVPILSLFISPVAAAAITLPIYVVSDALGLYLYRRHFSRRNLAILLPAGILGVAVGWAAFAVVPERLVVLVVGLMGVGFCLNAWLSRHKVLTPRDADVPRGLFYGFLTGFGSFIAHSGAPPYQMYIVPQRLDKLVFAGTSTIVFAALNVAKLPAYWALGQLSADNLALALALCPAALFGTFAGLYLIRIVPQEIFYNIVQVALFIVSLKLVYDGLAG